MSKVYSFRLDENSPRKAEAREVIDAWIAQGYSLRHQLVEVLIESQNKHFQDNEHSELLEKIEQLIVNSKENKGSLEDREKTLTDTFIKSLSNSMKNGLRVE